MGQYSKIIGTGSVLPQQAVSNDELAERLAASGVETSDEWIRTRTGICQRHIASPDTQSSDLAAQAAQIALDDAGLSPADIDLTIVATSTPDMIFPSTACIVQSKLGIKGAAFDVQAVCSGFVYSLVTADNFIRTGNAQRVLVIGAEIFSRIMDWKDRGTCVLFGDGAGAFVLQASDEPGILASKLNANGALHNILQTPGQIHDGKVVGDPFLRMDGQAVFKQAVTVLEKQAREACEKAGIQPGDLDLMVPHQANIRIISHLAKKLGLPMEQVVTTVDKHANTSAASIPLAYDTARRSGQITGSQTILLQGVGGGFTWGSVVLRT